MARSLTIAAALAAFAAPALAGQPVSLRPEVLDADGRVTLGDLFEGAGSAADTPVAARVEGTVVLDAGAVQRAAHRAGLEWSNAEGLRRIVVRAGASSVAASPRGNVEVLTYARSLAAGEVVQPQDLVWSKAAAAPSDAPSDSDAVIGLAARRPLRAGAAVLAHDVSAPQVIKAGELVTVSYEDGGISLALQGKALAAASLGAVVAIQNITSKKTIQAVASGPGQALVGPAADRLRSGRTSQYALR